MGSFRVQSMPDLPLGCIGCSLEALEFLGSKNDEKGSNFLGMDISLGPGPKTS
jgi:hypothetical protein